MRSISIFGGCLSAALFLCARPALAQCTSDDACKGERVCEEGKCVWPQQAARSAPAGVSVNEEPPPRDEKLWAAGLNLGPLLLALPDGVLNPEVEIERSFQPHLTGYLIPSLALGLSGELAGNLALGIRAGARYYLDHDFEGLWAGGDLGTGIQVVGPSAAPSFTAIVEAGYTMLFGDWYAAGGLGGGLSAGPNGAGASFMLRLAGGRRF